MIHWLIASVVGLLPFAARADQPGRFDYYVLALSWSPQYCAAEDQPQSNPQCTRPYGFVVHGLWPQHERGWPKNCGMGEYLGNGLIERMLPLMPSKQLVIHEWKKHGVCSGLKAQQYFSAVEQAAAAVKMPARYRRLPDYLTLSVRELERDFITANPQLKADGIAVQCGGRYLRELRICLNKDLSPRACASDVRDNCRGSVVLRPVRGG